MGFVPARKLLSTCIVVLAATACGSNDWKGPDDFTDKVRTADAATIQEWMSGDQPFVVLDVRTEKEYREDGRVAGSVLQTWSYDNKKPAQNRTFMNEVPATLDRNARIVVLCSHGIRATQAAWKLETEAGFTNVFIYPGGFEGHRMSGYPGGNGWIADGLPVEH